MAVFDRPGLAAVTAIAIGALLASCASSPSAPVPPSSGSVTVRSTSGAPPVEVNPPGDIPDNQAYVAYAGAGYRVSVPEGWARTTRATAVVFSDKYTSVTVDTRALASAPTTASVRATELPSGSGFALKTISPVRRNAGSAVLITYSAVSAVNPVTGKVARLDVERYAFWRAGHEVVVTLAAPAGSDNVDPWRHVTDSLRWA